MNNWVKKLGQWHKAENDASETLCGSPMLGNNYARHIEESDRTPCADCMDAMGFTHSISEVYEAFGLN